MEAKNESVNIFWDAHIEAKNNWWKSAAWLVLYSSYWVYLIHSNLIVNAFAILESAWLSAVG